MFCRILRSLALSQGHFSDVFALDMPMSEQPQAGASRRFDIPRSPSRPLAFMHVPKCAGTSITFALVAALAIPCAPWQLDRFHFGGQPRLAEISANVRHLILLDDTAPPEVLLAGHISLSSLRAASPGCQVISIMREPVCRLLSLWAFNASAPDAAFPPWGADWKRRIRLARRKLAGYLAEPTAAALTDNVVVRYLLQPHSRIPEDDFISPEDAPILLEEALKALALVDFVDIIENPRLTDELAAWLGRPLAIERHNEAAPLPDHLRATIADPPDDETSRLLGLRTVIDDAIWRILANDRMRPLRADALAPGLRDAQRRKLAAASPGA